MPYLLGAQTPGADRPAGFFFLLMQALLPYARLLALAALTSFSLTSCFDHDKKCDPKPSCSGKTTTTTPTTSTGGDK